MTSGLPQLRALQATPVRDRGRVLICLADPRGIAPEPVVIDEETFFIVSMFDGSHTILDMQEEYIRRFGSMLFSDRVHKIVRELDDHRMMVTPEFAIFEEAVIEEFAAASVRPAAGAGVNFPDDPTELATMMTALLKEAPVVEASTRPGKLCGLVSPHIDYPRGHAAYAHAMREIETLEGEQLVLVLGTSHAPMRNRFALTRKHFDTPLSRVETDVDFVQQMADALPFDAFADEFNHRAEHSIELTLVWLKFLLRQPDALKVIPVLCGSFEPLMRDGRSPADDEQVSAFLEAVGRTSTQLRRPTLVLAAADLSHVGPRFGESAAVTPSRLSQTEERDMQLLTSVGRGDAERAYQTLARDNNSTQVCGLAPIYVLLRLVEPARGRLLKYGQTSEPNGLATVSFASVGLYSTG